MNNRLLSCIDSKVENNRSFYGRFQLAPFSSSQAITVANSLRRSLLSELSGIAITAIGIEGAEHEFSTLRGVRESVLEILMNFKEIVLTSDFQLKEPHIGYLRVRGPATITTKEMKLPGFIQCVDPEQPIATLSSDGTLDIKFLICQGKNYIIQNSSELNNLFSSNSESTSELPIKIEMPNIDSNTEKNDQLFLNTINDFFSFKRNLSQLNVSKDFETEKYFFALQMFNQILNNPSLNFYSFLNTGLSPSIVFKEKNSNFSNLKTADPTLIPKKKSPQPQPQSSNLISDIRIDEKNKRGKNKLNNLKTSLSSVNEKDTQQENFQNQKRKLDVNKPFIPVLPLDTVFMPVKKVNFSIEPDGNIEDKQNRIILEIWTNGSIHPRKAIHSATKVLISLFSPFQENKIFKSIFLKKKKNFLFRSSARYSAFSLVRSLAPSPSSANIIKKTEEKSKKKAKEGDEKKKQNGKKNEKKLITNLTLQSKINSFDIGNLDLSLRSYTCLKRAKINRLGDLIQYSKKDLLLLKNFGQRSLEEVEKNLSLFKLKLNSTSNKKLSSLPKTKRKNKKEN